MEVHKHLSRLSHVWINNPRYFVTICTHKRNPILAEERVSEILRREWNGAWDRHGWAVGSYVVMPDHVHFFCTDGERGVTLSKFVGSWKEWTSKAIKSECNIDGSIWQKGFFDHLLRSDESYSEKWAYVRDNPIRAGFVRCAEDWPFVGFIHYR